MRSLSHCIEGQYTCHCDCGLSKGRLTTSGLDGIHFNRLQHGPGTLRQAKFDCHNSSGCYAYGNKLQAQFVLSVTVGFLMMPVTFGCRTASYLIVCCWRRERYLYGRTSVRTSMPRDCLTVLQAPSMYASSSAIAELRYNKQSQDFWEQSWCQAARARIAQETAEASD